MQRGMTQIVSVRNTFMLPVYRFQRDAPAAAFTLLIISLCHPLHQLSGKRIHAPTLFLLLCGGEECIQRQQESHRITMMRGTPQQCSLTDWLRLYILIIRPAPCQSWFEETQWWIVIDTMWMEEWPSGKELLLWHLSSTCTPPYFPLQAHLPSLCSHLSAKAWWLKRKHSLALHVNTNWIQSENRWATTAMIGEKKCAGRWQGVLHISNTGWVSYN